MLSAADIIFAGRIGQTKSAVAGTALHSRSPSTSINNGADKERSGRVSEDWIGLDWILDIRAGMDGIG